MVVTVTLGSCPSGQQNPVEELGVPGGAATQVVSYDTVWLGCFGRLALVIVKLNVGRQTTLPGQLLSVGLGKLNIVIWERALPN